MATEIEDCAAEAGDANVPRGTTPTWEIEMLLSGAVVFALMQMPGRLDAAFDRLFLKLDATLGVAALLVYAYGKGIVYALILTFLAHLAARAYWIALVGLDSVYPEGPKWAGRRMGPIARETIATALPPLRTLIGPADDRCSLIFASGILLVLYAVFSLFATGVVTGFAFVVSRLFFGGGALSAILLWIAVLTAIPSIVAMLVDRWRGDRLDRSRWPARAIAAINRSAFRIPVLRPALPLLYTLSSNRPTQRVYGWLVLSMLAIVFFVLGEVMVRREVLKFDMYAHLPDQPTSYALDPDHYEDRREPESAAMLPYVQSETIAGDYVRLFVPYLSERHEAGIARACPGLEPLSAKRFGFRRRGGLDDARVLRTLECFERMLAIELDGAPADVSLNFGSDASSGQRGLVAMIAVDGLDRGRHVLALRRPARRSDQPTNPATEEQPASGETRGAGVGTPLAPGELRYEIPFWR